MTRFEFLMKVEQYKNGEITEMDMIAAAEAFEKALIAAKPLVGRSFAIVRWAGNDHEDVVCINREVAEAYVEKYNKLSGEQSCYVDDDIYEPLSMA